MSQPRRRIVEAVLAVGTLVAGLGMTLYPVLLSGGAVVIGDTGDARLVQLVLENGFRALSGHGSVFQPPFFYPQPDVGSYTETLLGVQPLYAPWRWLGLGPHLAYQAFLFSAAIANFGLCWAYLRRCLQVDVLPAALGAFLFAFAVPRAAQLQHPQLWFHGWAVLTLWCATRFLQRGGGHWLAMGVMTLIAQLYASVYHGWFLGFVLLAGLIGLCAMPSWRSKVLLRLRESYPALGASLAMVPVLLWPLATVSFRVAREVGTRTFEEVSPMIPRVQSWLFQSPWHRLYGPLYATELFRVPAPHEHVLGIGLITTACLVLFLWRRRREPLWRWLGLTLLAVLLTALMYRGGHTPWRWVFEELPGARALRAVTRLGLTLLLPFSVVLSAFAQNQKHWIRVLLLAVCVAEQSLSVTGYESEPVLARQEALRRSIPSGCAAFLAVARDASVGPVDRHIDAMWAALESGVPTANGYSGLAPPGWHLQEVVAVDDTARRQLEENLLAWEIEKHLPAHSICVVDAP
jgi:hypothetical protein